MKKLTIIRFNQVGYASVDKNRQSKLFPFSAIWSPISLKDTLNESGKFFNTYVPLASNYT